MPRWFSEGLAVYEERQAKTGWGGDLSTDFVQAFVDKKLPRASQMNETFLRPASQQQLVHDYYQASLFIEFIVNEAGFDAIVQMLRGFELGHPFKRMVKDVLATSAQELDQVFDRFMHKRLAQAALALDSNESHSYPKLLAQARAAQDNDNTAEARTLLVEAMRLLPQHADEDSAYWALSKLETAGLEPRAAAVTLESMVAVNADSLSAHQALADLYRKLNWPARERDSLERALFVQPLDSQLHQRLADAYETENNWASAACARLR